MKHLLMLVCYAYTISIPFTFEVISNRDINIELPEKVLSKVIYDTKNMDVIEIANYCTNLVCEYFSYSTNVHITSDLKNSKGHCVTYSLFVKELCNAVYNFNNINAKATIVVGNFKCNNLNVNQILTNLVPSKYSRFFVNHDVVKVTFEDKSLLIDPSLTDILNFKGIYDTTSE